MRKINLILLKALFLLSPTLVQANEEPALFRAPLKFVKGDSLILEIVKEKNYPSNPIEVVAHFVFLKVLDTSDESTHLLWRRIATEYATNELAETPLARAFEEIYRKTIFKIKLTHKPVQFELENFKDVKSNALEAIEISSESLGGGDFTPAQVANVTSYLKNLFSSKEYAESNLMNVSNIFLAPYSFELNLEDKTTYEVALPLTGGGSLDSLIDLEIKQFDKEKGFIVVHWIKYPKSKESVGEAAKKLLEELFKPLEIEKKFSNLQDPPSKILNVGKYTLDLNTGWPTKVYFERNIRVGDGSISEKYSYRILEYLKADDTIGDSDQELEVEDLVSIRARLKALFGKGERGIP